MTDTTVITTSPANTNNAGITLREIRVPLLSNFYDTTLMQILLPEVMDVVTSQKMKEQTDIIRRNRQIQYDEQQSAPMRMQAKEVADKVKKQTPVIMPNAMMEGGKKRENIVRFLPLIAFDIDHISEEETILLMAQMKEDPHMVFGQPSSSRHGVHGLLHIDAADFLNRHWDGKHTDAYDYVWEQVRQYAKTQFGKEIDKQCKNTEHTLALCHDDLTFMNLEAVPLHIDLSAFTPRKEHKSTSKSVKKARKQPQVSVQLNDVLDDIYVELESQGKHFGEGERNAYIYQLAAICNDYGIEMEEVVEYCSEHFTESDFSENEISSTIKSAYKQEEKHGRRRKKLRVPSYDELMEMIGNYGQWRFNTISMAYEVLTDEKGEWRTCRDEDTNEIYRRALENGLTSSVRQLETLIHSLQTEQYNPIKQFMDSLPKCTIFPNGQCLIEGREEAHDYIGEVANRLHTTSSNDIVCHYFKKWIVQMVRSWIYDNEKNEIVFGLLGPQGRYKTTFFSHLLPQELRNKYFDTKNTNGQFSKDDMLKMCNILLYLQEEFDEMTPKELNQFKAIVSQTKINERRPYARNSENARRICSFAFTGNTREILNDSTGNRRFVPFWVESIDSPFDNPIDYEGFYAQAFALARPDSGFISYIPSEEMEALNEHNKTFCIPVYEHELINHYLAKPYGVNFGQWESVGVITAYLQNQAFKYVLDKRKVAAYLRQKGFQEKRTSDGAVFLTVHLQPEQIVSRCKMENSDEVS